MVDYLWGDLQYRDQRDSYKEMAFSHLKSFPFYSLSLMRVFQGQEDPSQERQLASTNLNQSQLITIIDSATERISLVFSCCNFASSLVTSNYIPLNLPLPLFPLQQNTIKHFFILNKLNQSTTQINYQHN